MKRTPHSMRVPRRLLAGLIAAVFVAGCGASDGNPASGSAAAPTVVEPQATETPAEPTATTEPEPEPTARPRPTATTEPTATPTSEPTAIPAPTAEETEPAIAVVFAPALDSPAQAISSWTQVVGSLTGIDPANADLAPTIAGDSGLVDPPSGTVLHVEQVNPGTAFGIAADSETDEVVAVVGMTDPDSGDVSAVFQIVWTINYGLGEANALTELLSVDDVRALAIGQELSFSHQGRSTVLRYAPGANAGDGIYLFSIADETYKSIDPSHSQLTAAIAGALITS